MCKIWDGTLLLLFSISNIGKPSKNTKSRELVQTFKPEKRSFDVLETTLQFWNKRHENHPNKKPVLYKRRCARKTTLNQILSRTIERDKYIIYHSVQYNSVKY